MKKHILLTFLILSQLAAISCGSDISDDSEVTLADTTDGETAAVEISDGLPEKNYNGYMFKMFVRNDDNFVADMWAESSNGDIMNDAIYTRNSLIADRFNIEFETIRSANVNGNDAKNVILAGEDAYDILVCHARTTSDYAHQQLLLEWNTELAYIDLDKPWWNQDARESFSINNKLYTCSGDISYQNLGAANAVFFNKVLLNELGINDIYDIVLSGKWTFDEFRTLTLQGSRDLNGDSKFDTENDQFGYLTSQWIGPIQVLYSGGQRICSKNAEDELVLSLNTERTAEIFDKFFTLTDSNSAYILPENDATPIKKAFAENRALFMDMNIKDVIVLRDMKADFGIIPWPKFDETEDKYYTNVDAGCNLIGVPITAAEPERTSVILEALCAEGYKSILPQYYEVALQTKYTRDDESVQMLDLVRDGRVFDAGYFYSNMQFVYEINSIGRFLALEEDHNFSSFYAKHESKALEKLKLINDIYK